MGSLLLLMQEQIPAVSFTSRDGTVTLALFQVSRKITVQPPHPGEIDASCRSSYIRYMKPPRRRRRPVPAGEPQVLTALRLPPALLARADQLRQALAAELGIASRTTVLRAAIVRGLDALEEQYK